MMFNWKGRSEGKDQKLLQKQRIRQRQRIFAFAAGSAFVAALSLLAIHLMRPSELKAGQKYPADAAPMPVGFHVTETLQDTSAALNNNQFKKVIAPFPAE